MCGAGPSAKGGVSPGQQQQSSAAILFTIHYLYSVGGACVKPPAARPYTVRMRCAATFLLYALLPADPAAAQRLPQTAVPEHYDLSFTIDLNHDRFNGRETIRVRLEQPATRIVLNAVDLE